MKSLHFFAGGNTARGFYSCFEDILPVEKRRRMYYLKGGPGVGKSTLMRRAAAYAEERGMQVEYYHCSSDPDSLDGVCLPEKGLALMDGTAPHVYDPSVPAARDTLLSLGDFLDEQALRPKRQQIMELQSQISARFRRGYRYLAAAEQTFLAPETGSESQPKRHRLVQTLTDSLPMRGGWGSVRRLFASAYTPKGRVHTLVWPENTRITRMECPFGAYATGLMQDMTHQAIARGLHVIQLLNPLVPEQIDAIYLPEHDMALVTGPRDEANPGLEAEKLFALRPAAEKELSFDRNAYELLLQRAVEQLAAAKALHDQLEGCYCGNMDFLKWQTVLDRVLEQMD